MGAGLIIRDPENQVLVDLTASVCQVLGSFDTGTSNGEIPVSWPAGRIPFFVQVPLVDVYKNGRKAAVTVNSNSISWVFSYPSGGGAFSANCRVFYGYY